MIRWLQPAALAAGALLQTLALVMLWRGGAVWPVLVAHVTGGLIWSWGVISLLPFAGRDAWWLPAGCTLVFPILGPLFSLVLAALLRRPAAEPENKRYLVWSDHTREGLTEPLPAGASGQSIVEILQSPRTQLRRNAVLALRDLEPQMAIPLLRKGLQDSDEQVRIYAQNILSSMLEGFESGIKELEQRFDAEPAAATHAVRLAEQYFELVYLEVAGDDETSAHYLQRAQALLIRAAEVAGDTPEIAFQGLRYALRARDRHQAQIWFAKLGPGAFDRRQALPWEMELAFMEGDWARLKELFELFHREGIVNPRIEELIRFWTGPGETT